MSQTISEPTHIYASIQDPALSHFFRYSGGAFEEEKMLLGAAIRQISDRKGYLSNKQIIIWLVSELETSNDVVYSDLIRRTLEVVVGFTDDDI